MSFPRLSQCIGRGSLKPQYKRVSLIHSIKNCLTRNTIVQSCTNKNSYHYHQIHNLSPSNPNNSISKNNKSLLSKNKTQLFHESLSKLQKGKSQLANFKYQEKLPLSLSFSTQDMYKLLDHLFNKKQHDVNDRNFIRRLLLRYFPEQLICAAGRDFITLLKFQKLKKGQRKICHNLFNQSNQNIIYSQASSNYQNQAHQKQLINKINNEQQAKEKSKGQKHFYFILKGKVRIYTNQFTFKKQSGQYFGQLQILGKEEIMQIQAKTDTMLLLLDQTSFNKHLSQYFINKYNQILKKVSLFQPILSLTSSYNQYRILQLMNQKQYKTGQKVIQKGQPIQQLVFMNNTQLSFSQNKILNQYKTVGLFQLVTLDDPTAKQTVYCMQNKIVYTIKIQDFITFIDKQTIYNYLSAKFYNFNTLSASKLASSLDDRTICSQNSMKIQNFVRIKKVRFTGNKRRVLTQPNSSLLSSVLMSSPNSSKKKISYPQYSTEFVFIKQNTQTQLYKNKLKLNRMKSINIKQENNRSTNINNKSINIKNKSLNNLTEENNKQKQLKEYLLKTKNSFRKKRWLDEIDIINQNSIINNPQIFNQICQKHKK